MEKKELSRDQQERIEADFLREEAARKLAEGRSRKGKRNMLIANLPLAVLFPLLGLAVGMFVFETLAHLRPVGSFDIWVVLWMIAVTFSLRRLSKKSLPRLILVTLVLVAVHRVWAGTAARE